MSDVIQWTLLKICSNESEAAHCEKLLGGVGIDTQVFYEDGTPVYPGPPSRGGSVAVRVERWNLARAKNTLKAAGIAPDSESERE